MAKRKKPALGAHTDPLTEAMMPQRGYVITPMGYVARVAFHEKLVDGPDGAFREREWHPFEEWLCEAHPELIGVTIPPGEYDRLVVLFREFKKATKK